MRLDEPHWWYGDTSADRLIAAALRPVAAIYGMAAERRHKNASPYTSSLPVICIGNFTAGGTGKTPVSRHVAGVLREMGRQPVFLTRGYKGCERGPVWVDAEKHDAEAVGDEPLLLARDGPVVVSRDRAAGARLIERAANPAHVIVMDDGLQNPGLAKTLTLAVVDAKRALGNRLVIPSGPLRAPSRFQAGLADAIIVNGPQPEADATAALCAQHLRLPKPILFASVRPAGDLERLRGCKVLAFAGIANPARFFDLLQDVGADIVDRLVFPDHHSFTDAEALDLVRRAETTGGELITTEKDLARIANAHGARSQLAARTSCLAISLAMAEDSERQLRSLIEKALSGTTAADPQRFPRRNST